MEKTIKYLENGEYHYATVRSVGDLAQLKTDSKETLVEAINELWNGGGNADLSKAPKPEGYDQLVQDVADAVKNQQEISQQWIEWQNQEAQLTEERKQAYLQAMKEMQEAIDKAKADAAALDDKTTKLDEQITKTFSDLDTSIQNMHEQLQKEADRMDQELIDTKSDLTKVRTDLQNAQLDNGRIHDELTNINGKFEHKVWQTDLDPLKEQIDRAETSVQQTKDELLGKASRQDLDTVTNTVSKLDTQLKETAKGVEISVKKDELGGEIAEALTNKTNILLGTRRFTTNNWTQRDHVEMCSDPWKGFLVAKQNSPIEGIQQAYDVKAGTTYTFSLFAKMDNLDDSNKPQITLAQNNLDTSLDTKIDVWRKDIDDITSDFKRYDLTFTPSEDCTIHPHVISNSNNPIFVCGYQLEIGKELTPWEPNQEDVGDYVEKSEAQFNVYNDKIQALTEKQRQQGDTQEQLRTEVTQTAEGVKQVSESLKNTNGDITKLRGDLERTADHMKSEYESYTNKAVGQISDSTLNLIRNSSFQNKDEDFAQWQNISAKANIRQDENGLRWVELTQSGLTTDNPQGITSNYFNVKQGKVTVAVDIKSGDKASLDNESVLFLELYNDAKKRVDFRFVTLSELSLSNSLLGDHKVHRGLYRLGIDRNDAKYMTVKAHLMRNGDLYFTNFSARLSSIDDGAYEPNPDDTNQQILKMNTRIEQDAQHIALKANSADVTRNIKDAVNGIQVGGTNLANKTNQGIANWMCDPGTGETNLTEININGVRGVRFNNTKKTTNWWVAKYALDLNKYEPDTDYVISFDIRASANVAPGGMLTIAGGDSGHSYFTDGSFGQQLNANQLTHVSMVKHTNENLDKENYESFYLNQYELGQCDWVDFVNLKIEKGNKGTAWSSAPQDTSDEIKSAKDAAIQVASDQINIHVNELSTSFDDKLNKRVNEVKTASEKFTSDGIEQTVTKITNVKNDVDRLGDSVSGVNGGSNLLKRTSLDESSGKAYAICYYEIPGGLGPGTYTLSGWARVDQQSLDHKQFIFIDPFTDDWSWSCMMTIPAGLDYQYNKMTFVVPDGTKPVKTVGVYLAHPDNGTNENNNDAISGIGYFKKIKLEKGNNATVWTPHDSEQVTKSRVSGGGINLLKLSSFRNTTIDELKKAWYINNPDVWINQNRSIVLDNKSGKYNVMDLTQTVKLEPDTDYVLSLHVLYGVTSAGKDWNAYTYIVEQDVNGNSVNPYKDNAALMANSYDRLQNTRIIHTSPNTHQGIVYLRASPGTQVEFNEVKLEKGQIGTPWSNAPDDISDMKQEVTASVKNLGDRVTTEVNSITSKVDNMKMGGRNLLKGTRDFNSKYWYQSGDHTALADNPADSSTKEIHSWLDWHSYRNNQTIQLDPSKDYMISADIAIYGGDGNGLYITAYGNLDGVARGLTNDINLAGFPKQQNGEGFKRVYLPLNTHGKKLDTFRIEGHGDWSAGSGSVFISKIALYEGNTPMAWSDSSDDFVEAIKEVNTKWDVANGQIQGKVTATDVNNILNGKGYATQSWTQTMFQMKSDSITLQAVRDNITNGIQNQVNDTRNQINNANNRINDTNNRINDTNQKIENIKVGNKNLFVGTNRGDYGWIISPGNGVTSKGSLYIDGENGVRFTNSSKTTSWWVIQFPFDMNKLKPNTSYTISFDIRTPQDRNENAFIGLARGDSSGSPFVESPYKAIYTKANQFVHITQTLTTTSNFEKNQQTFYFNNAGIGQCDWVDIVNLMMVEGTQSAEWVPADEEIGNGQNILRGTADFSWPTGIGTNGTVNLGYERFDDTTVMLHVWGNSGGGIYTRWGDAFPDGQIQIGETYTFSFDIKGNGTFASVGNESHDTNARGLQVPGDWQRVTLSGTVKEINKAFIIYFNGTYDVRIKNVKIERGSKQTSWTPHPFDDKDKGVNLLKSTAYWNPNDWNHISDGQWYDDNWTDNLGHKAYGRSNDAWIGLGQTVYVTPGVYTWSAQIYLNGLDSNDYVYPYMGDNQYNGTVQVQDIRKPMLGVNDQNKWINYSATFYVKNVGNLCVRPELNRDHGTIHVGSQKLEHGMVATPWSPSPLDDKNATITLDSADVNNMKTQGHYFVRNLANSPIAGWVYVDVTGNNNDRLKQEVYQDNGYEHRSRRWTGSGWTEWTTDVNNKNVISQINITPDQIKIASNKIVIDGNTDIHGTLRVPDVKLAGRNGNVDLSGDGINITKTNGAGINIASNGIQLTANTNGQNEIEGVITTAWSMNNKNQNGIGLVLTTEQELGRPYGGDILAIGSMPSLGKIHAGMVFDATGITPEYKKGFNWFAPHTLNGDGGVLRFPGAQDDLMLYPGNMPGSRQSNYSQPTLRLVHGNSQGSAGIQFQWDDIVPFGRIETSHSVMTPVYPQGDETNAGLAIGWVSWFGNSAYTQGRMPMIHRVNGNMHVNAGFAFFPDGNVVYWNGSKRANLTWAFANYDPYYEPEFGGF